ATYRCVAGWADDQPIGDLECSAEVLPPPDALQPRATVVGTLPVGTLSAPWRVAGVVLYDSSGAIIGVLALLLDPQEDGSQYIPVLSAFAPRVEAELETARRLRNHSALEADLRPQARLDPLTGALNHGAIAEA